MTPSHPLRILVVPLAASCVLALVGPAAAQHGGVVCNGCVGTGVDFETAYGDEDCEGITATLLLDVQSGDCIKTGPQSCHAEPCSYRYQIEWFGVPVSWRIYFFSGDSWTEEDDGHGFEQSPWYNLQCGDGKGLFAVIGPPVGPGCMSMWVDGQCSDCPDRYASLMPPPSTSYLADGRVDHAGAPDERESDGSPTAVVFAIPAASRLEGPVRAVEAEPIPDELLASLFMTPDQRARFVRFHTDGTGAPDEAWVAENLLHGDAPTPQEMEAVRSVAARYRGPLQVAADHYADSYQRRLIEKFEGGDMVCARVTTRGRGPRVRDAFSTYLRAQDGWALAIQMSRTADYDLLLRRQALHEILRARTAELEAALGR